jgi:tetratricopeptide (TPR) repeat protein
MWQRVSDSNQSAYETAVALWEPGDSLLDMGHSLDWGQYGDLQLGDYERAELWIARMEEIVRKNPGHDRATDALSQVRARLILESQHWATQPITDESKETELLATGISAVHLGDLELAQQAADRLAVLADAVESSDGSYYSQTDQPLQIMQKEVTGLIAIAEGDTAKGLALLEEGVAIAESMRPPHGAANPLKPVHELYGQALLEADDAERAVDLFSRSLLRTPNRPLSMLGLARSYAALGDQEAAKERYQKLAKVWKGRNFPGLEEANRYLAASD